MYLFINKILKIMGFRISPIDSKPFDTVIISFPKSGRTWLRMIIGKVFANYLGINKKLYPDAILNLPMFSELSPLIPKVGYGHESSGTLKPSGIDKQKLYAKNLKIIFMVRDPRDVLVSQYFSESQRTKNAYKQSISEFIFENKGSFDTIIEFYNSWADKKDYPKDFLLIKYEDMHTDTIKEVGKIIDFIGLQADEDILKDAVEFASFSNMRKIEAENPTKSITLKPANINDTNTYKTRKGKVGGYKNYFSEKEINYLNNKMKEKLSPFFGYNSNL